jgi:intracellular septation protein A
LHRFIYDYSENNLPRVRMLFYLLFGGLATLSLLFHNPLFLKIKGALATLFVALFFIYSPKFMQRPALYYLLVHVQRFFKTDNKSVYEMNLATGVLFLLLTFLNIFVTLYCNTSTWLLLKTILTPVIVVSFIVIQYILYNK